MMNLDKIDLLLIFHLSQDSRISLTKLGKLLDLTPAAVTYRINKLVKEGLILSFTINLNHDLLTPTFRSYQLNIQLSIQKSVGQTNKLIFDLQNSGYFDQLYTLASNINIMGITYGLSAKDLNSLTGTIQKNSVNNFTLVPILNRLPGTIIQEIIAENVDTIFCTRCRKTVEGEGLVTRIDSKVMSFGCRECRSLFLEEYEQITQKAKLELREGK